MISVVVVLPYQTIKDRGEGSFSAKIGLTLFKVREISESRFIGSLSDTELRPSKQCFPLGFVSRVAVGSVSWEIVESVDLGRNDRNLSLRNQLHWLRISKVTALLLVSFPVGPLLI
ncbi:TPA: hypothetical protein EYG59_19485 [Candidatus Poribacteria bacterium]|nr:hypothetical protein [Candidatus Poribacteria bacterium]